MKTEIPPCFGKVGAASPDVIARAIRFAAFAVREAGNNLIQLHVDDADVIAELIERGASPETPLLTRVLIADALAETPQGPEWVPTRWQHRDDEGSIERIMRAPFIQRCRGIRYDGVRYSVNRGGYCLNVDGEWEWEPQPSSRDDAFFARCWFTSFEAATATLLRATQFGAGSPSTGDAPPKLPDA